MPENATPPYGVLLKIDATEYPVAWPEVTARQVGVIRLLFGTTPQQLAAAIDDGSADLPEVAALAYLSRLQAGDKDADAGALLDGITLGTKVAIDRLDPPVASVAEDADPEA